MGRRYPGNLITRTPTALSSSTQYQSSAASGMWSVNTHAFYRKLNYWPTYGVLQPLAYDSTVRFQFDRTASGIKAIDTQGYDQTVTYNGDVTRAGGSYYSDGYNGWALGTNGNSYAYYNYYDTSAIGTGDFTLEGWIKPDTTLAERFFFYVGDYNGNYIGVCTDNSRNLFARSNDNSYITSGFGLSIGVAQNTWRHVALERWNGGIRTYVNGQFQQSGSVATNINVKRVGLGIPGWSTSTYTADDVRLSKAAKYAGSNFTPPSSAYSRA